MRKIYHYGMLIVSLIFFAKALEGALYRVPFPAYCGGTFCRMRRSVYALLGDVAGNWYMAYAYFLIGVMLFYFGIKGLRDSNKE